MARDMYEFVVPTGMSIVQACKRLASEAPAFMVFNDTRVEAKPGDTLDVLHAQYFTKREETMIVTTGKSIKIEVGMPRFALIERSCETPGAVQFYDRDGKSITLPANVQEAERVIAAYRRAIAEDVPYRKSEVE